MLRPRWGYRSAWSGPWRRFGGTELERSERQQAPTLGELSGFRSAWSCGFHVWSRGTLRRVIGCAPTMPRPTPHRGSSRRAGRAGLIALIALLPVLATCRSDDTSTSASVATCTDEQPAEYVARAYGGNLDPWMLQAGDAAHAAISQQQIEYLLALDWSSLEPASLVEDPVFHALMLAVAPYAPRSCLRNSTPATRPLASAGANCLDSSGKGTIVNVAVGGVIALAGIACAMGTGGLGAWVCLGIAAAAIVDIIGDPTACAAGLPADPELYASMLGNAGTGGVGGTPGAGAAGGAGGSGGAGGIAGTSGSGGLSGGSGGLAGAGGGAGATGAGAGGGGAAGGGGVTLDAGTDASTGGSSAVGGSGGIDGGAGAPPSCGAPDPSYGTPGAACTYAQDCYDGYCCGGSCVSGSCVAKGLSGGGCGSGQYCANTGTYTGYHCCLDIGSCNTFKPCPPVGWIRSGNACLNGLNFQNGGHNGEWCVTDVAMFNAEWGSDYWAANCQ